MHHLDPDFLPQTEGVLARFVPNPKGDIDGLLFEDGTVIHTPPHLSQRIADAVQIGERVSVAGVRPRGADVMVAVAIGPEHGARIVDDGPPKHHHDPKRQPDSSHAPAPKRSQTECRGKIRTLLHGPKGNIHGFVLADGAMVRFPLPAAEAFAEWLHIGAAIVVHGETVATEYGEIIDAKMLGGSPDRLIDVPKPSKPPKPKRPHSTRKS